MVLVMQSAMLLARVGELACALPIEHVVETMRPLPIEPIGRGDAALAMIDGLAMIRGAPVPVVDARKLLGVTGGAATRFVVLRTADRRIALAVDAVLGVRPLAPEVVSQLPPLLAGAHRDVVSAIAARDRGLCAVLDAARVLPDDAWRALEGVARGIADAGDR
jgi:purine-binding chemotaxis protein CheW